ncbi:MAG: hypothetical protein ACTSRU_15770 [Candidatus Hodarchaeales archaeon]
MKTLIDLVNHCFKTDTSWKFHVIQEKTCEWVNLRIDYSTSNKSIESSNNWNNADLVNLYWEGNLISSDSDEEIRQWIYSKKEINKVKGIAPDTNLIIPGYLKTFLRQLPPNPYDLIPVIVLFARSIQYELHTMRPFTYRERISSKLIDFYETSIDKWPELGKLWRFSSNKPVEEQLTYLSSERGRLGLKGTFEVDALHKSAPVIIVKPEHILHSPKVLEQTPFLNAVHDSLIRYEIDFIRQNTTLQVLFITNDKDQCKSANQEGINALHVKRPKYRHSIDGEASENINADRIRSIILGLLTRSAAVRITSKSGSFYLSWTWKGRSMDDITDHRIRLVDGNNKQTLLYP